MPRAVTTIARPATTIVIGLAALAATHQAHGDHMPTGDRVAAAPSRTALPPALPAQRRFVGESPATDHIWTEMAMA